MLVARASSAVQLALFTNVKIPHRYSAIVNKNQRAVKPEYETYEDDEDDDDLRETHRCRFAATAVFDRLHAVGRIRAWPKPDSIR